MAFLLVRHKVADYDKWKIGFDGDAPNREAAGSKGGFVFRNADVPGEVVILLEWNDLDKAREFGQSARLRETMRAVGVIDQPDLYYIEETDRPSV